MRTVSGRIALLTTALCALVLGAFAASLYLWVGEGQRRAAAAQAELQRRTFQEQFIEEYEEREKQSSGPPSGLGPSSNPANQSSLVEGEGTVGNLNKRPSLADRWGDMKDAEREKIEAKVQKGLPPQYQKMLEEYYKKLGKAQK